MGWNRHIRIILVVIGATLLFGVAYFSPNTGVNSDPRYTLLVSQALIEHRTVRLDTYQATIENQAPVEWRLWRNDGHIYYVYPLAASFLALPLVVALYQLGYDMRSLPNEDFGQNFLSAVTIVLIFLFLYKIARYYLPSKTSLVLAGVSVLGTTLISTLGTACIALLHTGQPNVISLDFPDALAVENALDGMPLGILLQKIVIAP